MQMGDWRVDLVSTQAHAIRSICSYACDIFPAGTMTTKWPPQHCERSATSWQEMTSKPRWGMGWSYRCSWREHDSWQWFCGSWAVCLSYVSAASSSASQGLPEHLLILVFCCSKWYSFRAKKSVVLRYKGDGVVYISLMHNIAFPSLFPKRLGREIQCPYAYPLCERKVFSSLPDTGGLIPVFFLKRWFWTVQPCLVSFIY